MQRQYAILDVFTDRPLSGNPLAVVLDADDAIDMLVIGQAPISQGCTREPRKLRPWSVDSSRNTSRCVMAVAARYSR